MNKLPRKIVILSMIIVIFTEITNAFAIVNSDISNTDEAAYLVDGCTDPLAANYDMNADLNGIWTVTLVIPEGPFKYKYAHDVFAGQKHHVDDMQDGATYATVTDLEVYTNRFIQVPAVLNTNDTYGSCTSCEADSMSCRYLEATKYDPRATIDNGSCTFDITNDCPTDLDGDGATNGIDFSIFLGNFGLDCPPSE